MCTGAKKKSDHKMSYEKLHPDSPSFLDIDTAQFLGISSRGMGGNIEIHQYSVRSSSRGFN